MEVMTSSTRHDVVHHLYRNPGNGYLEFGDLLPYCGALPGRDRTTGDWHTGHGMNLLLQCLEFGLCCCSVCLSPEALGGWSPLSFYDASDQEDSDAPEGEWWTD